MSEREVESAPSPRDPLLFALIIGINEYKEQPHLRGAVADANAWKNYFTTSLGVDESRIISLIDKEATRANIIREFKFLSHAKAIQRQDPIVIFFAGHGADARSPPGWEAGGNDARTQFLMAYDSSIGKKPIVTGIPDRTVAALLDRIAEKKGNNITVILDCCHSASGTRGIGIRSVPIDYSVPQNLDADIWQSGERKVRVAARFLRSGLNSHILLAACGAGETARETVEPLFQGHFSTELLQLLNATPPENLRYPDILEQMCKIDGQNPQLEGVNRDRLLFDGRVRAVSSCQPSKLSHNSSFCIGIRSGQYFLEAGIIQGITVGAQFEVYWDNKSMDVTPLGVLVVSQLLSESATLGVTAGQLQFAIPPSAVAVRVGQENTLSLFVSGGPGNADLLNLVKKSLPQSLGAVIVNDKHRAHLVFSALGQAVKCRIVQPHYKFSYDWDGDISTLEAMSAFLHDAAHFHRYLSLSRIDNGNPKTRNIQVEIFELESVPISFYSRECPVGNNLITNNFLDIVVGSENHNYGIKITNETDTNLYPHVFYFDNSDFSIASYYMPSQTSDHYTLDSPLRSKGSLAIGYGASGWPPISFYLPPGQDMDLGFLKIFLSKSPNDLSYIIQPQHPSPGHRKSIPMPSEASLPSQTSGHRKAMPGVLENPVPSQIPDPTSSWGTVTIPIRQRR